MPMTQPDQDTVSQLYTGENECPVTKQTLRATIQAIEDVFVSAAVQNALNNAINAATSPIVLRAAQKKALVKFWLKNRFDRGN